METTEPPDGIATESPAAAAPTPDPEAPAVDTPDRLESIVESLLFAADKPLSVVEIKRLCGERDVKKIGAALEAIRARHEGRGVQLAAVAHGFQFRTAAENVHWVGKLLAGRPQRLSRAMLETLAIVAYRQPITRPEIDQIRGVDCGPVLHTLLDRGLCRIIGKKEEVGRPLLYGTTPEFLRTFSLRDLTEMPTLREFHELTAADQARVDAEAPPAEGVAADGTAARGAGMPEAHELADVDPGEDDELCQEIDAATERANAVLRSQSREERAARAAEEAEVAEAGLAVDGDAGPDADPA